MTVSAYIGEKFTTTHENQAFNELYRRLLTEWQESDEEIVLLGNFFCEGNELDCAVLKKDSITVIDFKNYGGKLSVTENGPWKADEAVVKGGSKANPLIQIKENKFALLNFLQKKNLVREWNNLGHISGLLLFHKPVEFNYSDIPDRVASWFHISDMDHVIENISNITSRQINLTKQELATIPSTLHLSPYEIPGADFETVKVTAEPTHSVPELTLTEHQARVLALFDEQINLTGKSILQITGLTSTGKTLVAQKLIEKISAAKYEAVCLAPNARIAGKNSGFHSIYGRVYSSKPMLDDDNKKQLIYPVRNNDEAIETVFIIDEAQLIADSYFETDSQRYGTGKLLTDFIEYALNGGDTAKVIVLGDQYQLGRGKFSQCILNESLMADKGFTVLSMVLDEQIRKPNANQKLVDGTCSLIKSIDQNKYSSMEFEVGSDEFNLANQQPQLMKEWFRHSSEESVYLCFSNEAATQFNNRVKTGLLGQPTPALPEPGDRVEIQNSIQPVGDGLQRHSERITAGSLATVISRGESMPPIVQPLSGRKQPIILRFRKITLKVDNYPGIIECLYLKEYLSSVKPELSADESLALFVNTQSRFKEQFPQSEGRGTRPFADFLTNDPYYNSARLRFAYAMTCHHAQGRKWKNVVINADTGKGRNNEDYYRWIYTALTRSSGNVLLSNYEPITPLQKAVWKDRPDAVRTVVKIPNNFDFPVLDSIPEALLSRALPSGFVSSDIALISLLTHIQHNIPCDVAVTQVKQSPYQELYTFRDRSDQICSIRFSYNKDYKVSSVNVCSGNQPLTEKILHAIKPEILPDSEVAADVYEFMKNKLRDAGITVENLGQQQNQLVWYLSMNEQQAIVDCWYNDQGLVSTIMPRQASGAELLLEIAGALGLKGGE